MLVAAAIVVIAGLCLYLLFRRGSIADRARTDMPDPEPEPRTGPTTRSLADPRRVEPRTAGSSLDQAGPDRDVERQGP